MKQSTTPKTFIALTLAMLACIGATATWLNRPDPVLTSAVKGRAAVVEDVAGREPSREEVERAVAATTAAMEDRQTGGVREILKAAGEITGKPLDVRGVRPDGPSQAGRVMPVDAAALSRTLARLKQGDTVALPLPDGSAPTGTVNLTQREAGDWVRVGGALTGGGSFSLAANGREGGGLVQFPDEHRAFKLEAAEGGRLLMTERRLGDVVCEAIPRRKDLPQRALIVPQAVVPPVLDTRPAATAVLFIDFDGATVTDADWNNGASIVAPAARLTAAQMTEVVNRVKEDYWAFNISVTTNPTRYTNAPVKKRMRCIVTANDVAAPGAGGVAYVGSFAQAGTGFSSTIPAWVFEDTDAKSCADAIAHELGHTLGLNHDGRTSPAEEYYAGQGSGATGWAPIMGVGYYEPIVQWSKGEYANANNTEDDIAKIAGTTNGFGFVADEAGGTIATAAALTVASGTINQPGVITQQTDIDVFSFTTTGGTATINANPAPLDPNVDILLELLNSSGTVLASNNPTAALNATITQTLAAGTYYVRVRGTANGDPRTTGYSAYGCIGAYTITGTIAGGSGGGGGGTTTVATPTFSPGTGTYTAPVTVSLATATTGATIRYTTNGVDPTSTSTAYTAPITLSTTTTVKARAFLTGATDSAVASATYTIDTTGGVTTVSNAVPVSGLTGVVSNQRFFKVSVPAGQATLSIQTTGGSGDCDLYVKAGTQPTTTSYTYSSTGNTTAESIAVTNPAAGDYYILLYGYTAYSGVTLTATYTAAVGTVATPTFSPGTGTYTSAVTVSLATATTGATIRYTTNGVDPTSASTAYTAPIAVSATTTVKARAFKTGMNDSAVATATYTITTTGTGNVLTSGVPVTGLSGALNSELTYKITVPAGQTMLTVQTSGGTGDVDLYVKAGAQPTTSVYDLRGYTTGNAETVTVANPVARDYYIMLKGYAAYSGVTLVATYSGSNVLTNGVPVTGLAGATGSQKLYKISVPAGRTQLVIRTSGGSGDADLYVRSGSAPTTSTYSSSSTSSTTTETVTINNPAAGDWYVLVYGYAAYSGVSVVGTY